jgi:nucleotide-binding universal stress UspA family protein
MRRAATAAKLREATQRETRMRITRIIVPVDGSEPAKRAIALAAGLAAPAGAACAARIEKVTEFGDPATRILEVAAREDGAGTMVAMGRRGLGRIGRLLMGSVSTKVAQLATQPCLVVP